jgi:hypothetical protein
MVPVFTMRSTLHQEHTRGTPGGPDADAWEPGAAEAAEQGPTTSTVNSMPVCIQTSIMLWIESLRVDATVIRKR